MVVYLGDEAYAALAKLKDELRFVFITSAATIEPLANKTADALATENEQVALHINVSQQTKCTRCWHHREDIGQNSEHPELCGRCVDNVVGDGEKRQFA